MKWYLIAVVLTCVIFMVILIFTALIQNVSGETEISLKDLNYELLDDDVKNTLNRTTYYNDATVRNELTLFDYYNLTDGVILCDTHMFNFSQMSYLYLDVYNPYGNNLKVDFYNSYVYGTSTSNVYVYGVDTQYYLDEMYYDHHYERNTSMNHIDLYYSDDNFTMVHENFQHDSGTIQNTYIQYMNDINTVQTVEFATDDTITGFERIEIQIQNNFEYSQPELRYFNYIHLYNESNYLYLKDWGFIYDGDISEISEYRNDNYTFMKTYANTQYFLDINLTQYSDYPSITLGGLNNDSNILAFSAYDHSGNQHYLNFEISEDQAIDYFYSFRFNLYTTVLDIRDEQTGFDSYHDRFHVLAPEESFISNHGVGGSYEEYPLVTGLTIFMNENSVWIQFKRWYNIDESGNTYDDFNIRFTHIEFSEPKVYYGFLINTTLYDTFSFVPTESELTSMETAYWSIDAKETDITSSTKRSDSFKIKGDWGYFDVIRKGLNGVIGGIGGAFENIIDFLDPLWAALDSIADQVKDSLSPLFTALENAVDAVTSAVTDLYDSFTDFVIDFGLAIVDILDSLGVISTLLTVAAWVQDIIDVVATVGGDILSFIIDGVTWFVDSLVAFIQIVSAFFTAFNDILLTYLLTVTAITMLQLLSDAKNNRLNIDDTLKRWVYLVILPIYMIYVLVVTIIQIIGNFTPFT